MPTEQNKKPSSEEQRAAWRVRKTQSLKQKKVAALLQERAVGALLMPGEIRPGQDATTIADALLVARLFLRAASKPDAQPGESLLDLERRAFDGWIESGLRALELTTGRFSPVLSFTNSGKSFDDVWNPLPGAREPLTPEMLVPLPFSERVASVAMSQVPDDTGVVSVAVTRPELLPDSPEYWRQEFARRRAVEERRAQEDGAHQIATVQQLMKLQEAG
jgi:hypothetical protein